MTRRHRFAFPLLLLPLALSACEGADTQANAGPDAAPAGPPADASVVQVTGVDYAFEAPADVASGWTTFRLVNQGTEPHHLTLFRLEEGRTADDLVQALQEQRPLVGIATAVGGPNAPMPGAESNATVNLRPGDYALVCLVPSPDGVPHVFKGMVRTITVRADAAPAAEPVADADLTLRDYAFELSGDLTAGPKTIRVTNAADATEPHEVVLARLAPGTTAEELNAWIHAMNGPPPAEFLGGATALDPGESNTFEANLTPGEYALICPLPSVEDGEPHSMKGMVQQVSIR